jgi:S1-C subfamily serine protease
MILVPFFMVLYAGLTLPCMAEVYKYQDEHGRWHFTDKPRLGNDAPITKADEKETTTSYKDLAALLQEKYQPETPIDQASLAVVAITSPLAQGSGFFISDDGHIITNKHVVKPGETAEWKELKNKLAEREKHTSKPRTYSVESVIDLMIWRQH